MRIYDLSTIMEARMPGYPKDPNVVEQAHRSFKKNAYNLLTPLLVYKQALMRWVQPPDRRWR